MSGYFLVFNKDILKVVKIVVERYSSSKNFCEDWYEYLSEQDVVVKYLGKVFGICRLEALALLSELYTSPRFHRRGMLS